MHTHDKLHMRCSNIERREERQKDDVDRGKVSEYGGDSGSCENCGFGYHKRERWTRSMKKTALLVAILLLVFILTGCGSSYYTAKPGECMWCDGVGYAMYKDASGNYVRKTCSHCGGSGRR